MELQSQLERVTASAAWRRLAGIILLVPTEEDRRHEQSKSNRLSHTIQVMDIAAKIADKFGLDTDVVKLMAAVHDIGHLPYGHYAEKLVIEDIFPNLDLRVRHNENGPRVYADVVSPRNAETAVVCGIREHREIEGFHLTPESWAVAHADDLATVISNIQDGLSLPGEDGHPWLSMDELRQQLEGPLLEAKDPCEWSTILLEGLSFHKPSGSIVRSPGMKKVVAKLHSIATSLHRHPWIRAERLRIRERLKRCFDEKLALGMQPQEVIDRCLLTMTEQDMARFAPPN